MTTRFTTELEGNSSRRRFLKKAGSVGVSLARLEYRGEVASEPSTVEVNMG